MVTFTNLLESLSNWTCNVQDVYLQIIVFVDFSKAFDEVHYYKLF